MVQNFIVYECGHKDLEVPDIFTKIKRSLSIKRAFSTKAQKAENIPVEGICEDCHQKGRIAFWERNRTIGFGPDPPRRLATVPADFGALKSLPVELRAEIWKNTLTPRLVPETCWRAQVFDLEACPEIPLLGISEQSIAEILTLYKDISLQGEDLHILSQCRWFIEGPPPKILYNPEVDVLSFESLRMIHDPPSSWEQAWLNRPERNERIDAWCARPGNGPLMIYPNLVKKVQVGPTIFVAPEPLLDRFDDDDFGGEKNPIRALGTWLHQQSHVFTIPI